MKRNLGLVATVGALAVVLTLVLATRGGGGDSGGVASLTDATGQGTDGGQGSGDSDSKTADHQEALLAYAKCMRFHGVRNFPDPDSNGVMDIGPGIDTHSPTFLAAERECRVDAPGGRLTEQQEAALNEQMLRFASCMRANGVRAFPDPVARNGHIEMPETNSPGLDKDLPVFRAAQTACQGLLDPRYVGKLVDGLRGKRPAGSGKSK